MRKTPERGRPLPAAADFSNRNRIYMHSPDDEMMKIQIYEIQDPAEAEAMIELGVDHIGSVIVSETDWKISRVKDTVEVVRSSKAKSSLIPLFNGVDAVMRTLDYYRPDIVHFCEDLTGRDNTRDHCRRLVRLQENVKKRFPHFQIMRSIPIARSGITNSVPALEFAERFEPVSDFFLTDTLLPGQLGLAADSQPVRGFVGITGQTCDWETARRLVAASRIPVILAGGISSDNVVEGIMRVRPGGVDSCTLTNATDERGLPIRFRKDSLKVKKLVDAVRQAEKILSGEN